MNNFFEKGIVLTFPRSGANDLFPRGPFPEEIYEPSNPLCQSKKSAGRGCSVCKRSRIRMKPAGKKLWEKFLLSQKFPFLRRQPIDDYIVDFYCAEKKLVIEVGGELKDEGDDEERTAILNRYGLRVLRFSSQDVLGAFDVVCEEIKSKLN